MNMPKITRDSLMTLEAYARARNDMRTQLMQHKQIRMVRLGDHVSLIFEDETTMRYQIQEMLRAEKIFEEAGIQDELDAYNPLIPDGGNWKATMMIQYPEEAERRVRLTELKTIEDHVYIQVDGHARVYAIADEDLDRTTAEKTSAVHFLRFELTPPMITAAKSGSDILMGLDLPAYTVDAMTVNAATRTSLTDDLHYVM
jgi:hypothetical protein